MTTLKKNIRHHPLWGLNHRVLSSLHFINSVNLETSQLGQVSIFKSSLKQEPGNHGSVFCRLLTYGGTFSVSEARAQMKPQGVQAVGPAAGHGAPDGWVRVGQLAFVLLGLELRL